MPQIKSAFKRVKTSEKRRQINREVKSQIGTLANGFLEAIAAGDKAAASERFRRYCSVLDKAVKKGVIKANTADRRKARSARKVAALAS